MYKYPDRRYQEKLAGIGNRLSDWLGPVFRTAGNTPLREITLGRKRF